jgi:molybdopterin-guanine dinucleotide biosynthesis protein A
VRKSIEQIHKEDIGVIILAGGQARRLGDKRPAGGKAECTVGGKSLLRIVSEALVPVADSVLVVGGDAPKSFQRPISVRHISDSQPESGPLHAVRDGLRWIWREHICAMPKFVILSACDLPMINSALVLEMLRHFPKDEMLTQWVIPQVGSRLQYLFSVCRPTLLHSLDSYLAAGARDFHGFVHELQNFEPKSVHIIDDFIWVKIDPNGCVARDIDTPADLTAYTKPTSH